MKLTRVLRLALAGLLLLGAGMPRAFAAFDPIGEDIDIFLANPSFSAERPNVLLMLDNTANWNTAFANEKGALVSVVNALSSDFNVGLMLYDEAGQPVNHGSYVRFAVRQMTTANKSALSSMVNALDKLGDKGNNNTISEMINEAYLYWAGLTANTGFGQAKRDYFGNSGSNPLAASLSGNPFDSSADQIFQEVQSVNSVFASSTLPVSVNVRGTNLNQVYIGVFRPDQTKAPRWFGNLKLYDLKLNVNGDLFLADANGDEAADNINGFIKGSATSFWTASSTFWSFRSPFDASDVGQQSDKPDGNLVEKGGMAEMLRIAYPTDQSTRKLYTCTGSCPCSGNSCATPLALSGSPFNNANASITAAALGALLTKSVTSLTSVGTTALATSALHGFATNDIVVISGASPATYNGSYAITVIDVNNFSYTLPSSPAGNTATMAAEVHRPHNRDLLTVSGSTHAGEQ